MLTSRQAKTHQPFNQPDSVSSKKTVWHRFELFTTFARTPCTGRVNPARKMQSNTSCDSRLSLPLRDSHISKNACAQPLFLPSDVYLYIPWSAPWEQSNCEPKGWKLSEENMKQGRTYKARFPPSLLPSTPFGPLVSSEKTFVTLHSMSKLDLYTFMRCLLLVCTYFHCTIDRVFYLWKRLKYLGFGENTSWFFFPH